MEVRPLRYIAEACGGDLLQGREDRLVGRVSTDSRTAQAGDLFFALRGSRFDGHDFVAEVARKGAAAVVVDQLPPALPSQPCGVLRVDDTRRALGRLAARYRQEFDLPVIAVGGSNGKTTTKELVASVLAQRFVTLRSEASFNNDIGVPLTLLNLERRHQVAVIEVGTNHPGELAPLVRMARPQFGVIPNLGREHLEFFGDLAGVAAEEGWLAELLPTEGVLIIQGDNPWSETIAARTRAKVVRIGWDAVNLWWARDVRMDLQGVAFSAEGPRAELSGLYRLNLLGRHQVLNALCAVAVGAELGLTRAEIQRGLAEGKPLKMRMQLGEVRGLWVLDDSYNANPDSMVAALETLRELPCEGRKVAVLGDMAELGAHSAAAHQEVGRATAELGVQQLFAVGKMAGMMATAARAAGLVRVFEFEEVCAAAQAVKRFVRPGDLVLVKASRATGLERVVEALRMWGGSGVPAGQAEWEERLRAYRAGQRTGGTGGRPSLNARVGRVISTRRPDPVHFPRGRGNL